MVVFKYNGQDLFYNNKVPAKKMTWCNTKALLLRHNKDKVLQSWGFDCNCKLDTAMFVLQYPMQWHMEQAVRHDNTVVREIQSPYIKQSEAPDSAELGCSSVNLYYNTQIAFDWSTAIPDHASNQHLGTHRIHKEATMSTYRAIPLKSFLAKAFEDAGIDSYSVIGTKDDPMLRSDGPNRLLVYCGSFNPPHIGHVSCFADGIDDCVREYKDKGGILAAIPIPLDDEALFSKKKLSKILTRTQRADLLGEHLLNASNCSILATNVQVWSTSKLSGVADFLHPVASFASTKGFPIEFVVLRGGDHMYFDRVIQSSRHIHPRCTRLLFSESAGRFNPDTWVDGKPQRFQGGWSDWAPNGTSSSISTGEQLQIWSSSQAATPTWSPDGGSEARLLIAQTGAANEATEGPKSGYSSTRIRKVVAAALIEFETSADRAVLIAKLQDAGALSPEMLASLLVAGMRT